VDASITPLKKLVEPLQDQITNLEQNIHTLQSAVIAMKERQELLSDISSMKKKLNIAASKANDNEQYSRQYSLCFIGIKESAGRKQNTAPDYHKNSL